MTLIHASAIGEPALRLMQSGGQARVTGVTSKGIFLQNDQENVLFLSFEDWRGPLTINLAPMEPSQAEDQKVSIRYQKTTSPFDRLQTGCLGRLTAQVIVLPPANIRIAIQDLSGWKAQIPSPQLFDWTAIPARLHRVMRLVATAGAGKGWSSLFSYLEGDFQDKHLSPELTTAWGELDRLRRALRSMDAVGIATSVGNILGRGGGLTPSGDDVLIGLLIGTRFIRTDRPDAVSKFPGQVVELARQKTTALSVNLLACAIDGQADERITTALHAILTGSLPAAECARRLLSYGGSSGGDTLLGMALALSLH